MIDSTNALIAGPRLEDRTAQWVLNVSTGKWKLVHTGNIRRDVRGIPVRECIFVQADAANDNIKGGRYPLEEEFKAKRLGKWSDQDGTLFDMSEGAALWSTAKWFGRHHDIANRPHEACSYGIGQVVTVGELGGFIDPEEDEADMGSTDPFGYQMEFDPLYTLGGVDPSYIKSTGLGESRLEPLESRARSVKICQQLKYRMDCNYRHVVDAVLNRCEMRAIGMAEGVREGAATAGRMLVRAGLRTATLVRLDIARWEASGSAADGIGPLPNKPTTYSAMQQRAANDDIRRYVHSVA